MRNRFKKLRDPKVVRKILAVVLVIGLVASYLFLQKTRNRVSIEDSQIMAPLININPDVAGELSEMDAVEGHSVKSGDALAVVGGETLRAQSDGLIISASDQTGSTVSPQSQTPLIQMINPIDLRVVGTLDENKGLSKIQVGQVVSFTVDALPGQIFWGYVDEVGPTAKATQLAFSISSERPVQQFEIYVRFDSSSYPQIKNGMSAKMKIYTNE